jgi:hypothetical protein
MAVAVGGSGCVREGCRAWCGAVVDLAVCHIVLDIRLLNMDVLRMGCLLKQVCRMSDVNGLGV